MKNTQSRDTFHIPDSDRLAQTGTALFGDGEQVDFHTTDPNLMSAGELGRLAAGLAKSKDAPMKYDMTRLESGGVMAELAEQAKGLTERPVEVRVDTGTLLQQGIMVVTFRNAPREK